MSIKDSINTAISEGRFKSLSDLAEATKIPLATLQRIQKGQEPKFHHVTALAKVGIKPSVYFNGDSFSAHHDIEPTPFYAADLAIQSINSTDELLKLQDKITSRIRETLGQYNLAS